MAEWWNFYPEVEAESAILAVTGWMLGRGIQLGLGRGRGDNT